MKAIAALALLGVTIVPSVLAQTPDTTTSDVDGHSDDIICYFPPVPEMIGTVDSLHHAAQYTPAAREAGITGRVIVQAYVESDGRVTEAKVKRGLGYGLDEEALRVVHQLRFRWPSNADTGRVQIMVPIEFDSANEK